MGEERTYDINDTHRSIQGVLDHLEKWKSPYKDPRVAAIIRTKLEEAQLWSLYLVNDDLATPTDSRGEKP